MERIGVVHLKKKYMVEVPSSNSREGGKRSRSIHSGGDDWGSSRGNPKTSWEVLQEEKRVEYERHAVKKSRNDNLRDDDCQSVSGRSVASWRSLTSSKFLNKDRMAGGHVVPRLEDALKNGGIMFFKGTGTGAAAVSVVPSAVPENCEKNDLASAATTEEEFVERLASQIEEKTARELDRNWYNHEESCDVDAGRESIFDDSYSDLGAKEDRYRRDMTRLRAAKKKTNPLWSQEEDLWELNRLTSVGMHSVGSSSSAPILADDNESRTVIVVKELNPEFLEGRAFSGSRLANEEIRVVKDVTSDMAVCARKGSGILLRLREETERSKMRERFWELAGTTLGRVLGIEDDVREQQELKAIQEIEEEERNRQCFGVGAAGLSANSLGRSLLAAGGSSDASVLNRQNLPIHQCRNKLMRIIRENRVVIVVGETGSGKTTQLTQYLYDEGFGHNGMMIGCTQPRRVAAVSVARRVAEEFGCDLGREVGYSIRFEDCTTPEVTRIKYMTDAFLLREILSDSYLDRYDSIIMDEAHERSLATDVLFGLLKSLVNRRLDLKLIITSATMNSERFSEFFGAAPIFTIPGRTFPVKIIYSRSPCVDYIDSAIQKCLEIHFSYPYDPRDPSDILIFMTGQEDIEGLCILLSERVADTAAIKQKPVSILPIYSQLPSDLQGKIFEKSLYRKIIVATNIAETSLTLDGIKFVIDSGYCKLKVFSPKVGMDTLQLTPISRANANQRSGRAGRTAPGICYRLFTERAFLSEMFEVQVPEIQRTNLAHVVLLLKNLNIKDIITGFDFMDPPPMDTIINAMIQLWMLGALDEHGDLTTLGTKMAHLPVDPSLAKMILLSTKLKCTTELVTVVSMVSVPSIFYRPKGRAEEADSVREKFSVPESDHLTLLNVYQQWNHHRCSPVWASKHFIHQKSLIKVKSVRDQLLEIMKSNNILPVSCQQEWTLVRKTISSGYFHHAAKLRGLGQYVNLQTSLPCHLHPSSSLFLSGLAPEYVVYHEVTVTSKEYMQNVSAFYHFVSSTNQVTAIEPQWLAELGPMLFETKQAGGS